MAFEYLDNLIDEIGEAGELNSLYLRDYDSDIKNIPFDHLYSDFFKAVMYLNKISGNKLILIDILSVEICRLLLNPDHQKSCFYLTSTKKYVFIFEQYPGQIAFLGKYVTNDQKSVNTNRNFIQLFILNYKYKDKIIEFKDNTGNGLSTEEVIYQILRWLLLP